MLDVGISAGLPTVVGLVVVSFVSFFIGAVLRQWPDKIQAYAEEIDGSMLFLSPQAQRALLELCSRLLWLMSFVALLAAAIVA
jgi:hypothetical protein